VDQLIAIDKRVTDYIDDLCREHETEVNELKRKLDASSEASTHERTTVNLLTYKLEKAEKLTNALGQEIAELHESRGSYMLATKGHTIENITTMMDTMPPAEDLEGYEVRAVKNWDQDPDWLRFFGNKDHPEKGELFSHAPVLVRTPIIEYIPTEDITDSLCEELGRIPCEVRDRCEDWENARLIAVDGDVFRFVALDASDRAYSECRIERSTIERLRAEK
jgi:hypothetical protein